MNVNERIRLINVCDLIKRNNITAQNLGLKDLSKWKKNTSVKHAGDDKISSMKN